MQIWQTETKLTTKDLEYLTFFPENATFFDIETTGFSAGHAICYLIGCASRKENRLLITQFFADQIIDEQNVLEAFLAYIADFQILISFNGTGFDLPFLQKRCEMLSLPVDFTNFQQTDIFKEVSALKEVFCLPNYKQKAIEAFLGIMREDQYNGGELINQYFSYEKTQDSKLLSLLKLHNYEDVLGMTKLLPIFSYISFFQGNFHIASLEKNTFTDYAGEKKEEMLFSLTCDLTFPKRLTCRKDGIHMVFSKNIVQFSVPIYSGELKFFYQNYKDYYYLPKEDMAIHKSVAFYVDKNYRTQAKAATCYSKKTGCFLPQFDDVISPYFKLEYNDTHSYFECTREFYESDDDVKRYCMHILHHFLEKKKQSKTSKKTKKPIVG
ncbi:MAG: ribonuclease H-like domain-containing protein [Lachnospiraceae bacterium]